MRGIGRLPLAACLLLSACGGGGGIGSAGSSPTSGGSTGSTPAPTPTPTPTPVNTSVSALKSDQTFSGQAATSTVGFNLDGQYSYSGSSGQTISRVRYDATNKTYTIEDKTSTRTFGSQEQLPQNYPGEQVFVKIDGQTRDILTLAVQPYSSNTLNTYVGMAYTQHDSFSNNVQNTTFTAFPYGFETPASAVPHTGFGNWTTDVFALLTETGHAPKSMVGPGSFNIDLTTGTFSTEALLDVIDLSTKGQETEKRTLIAQGKLTSGNSFTGTMKVSGFIETLTGPVSGQFYGPTAQEIGASLSATNPAGTATLAGALTGQRTPDAKPVSLALTNIVAPISFAVPVAEWVMYKNPSLPFGEGTNSTVSSYTGMTINIAPDGTLALTPAEAILPPVTFTAADRIAQSGASTTYRKTVNGEVVTGEFYRPGSVNQELALTYVSLASWSSSKTDGSATTLRSRYFAYGFATPYDFLVSRTGTARYDGVAKGVGSIDGNAPFAVGGTSRFDIDFGASRYSGSLTLDRRSADGGNPAPLGTWTFASVLRSGNMEATSLHSADNLTGINSGIIPRFYGPAGEEIGAIFNIKPIDSSGRTGLTIAGATVARH